MKKSSIVLIAFILLVICGVGAYLVNNQAVSSLDNAENKLPHEILDEEKNLSSSIVVPLPKPEENNKQNKIITSEEEIIAQQPEIINIPNSEQVLEEKKILQIIPDKVEELKAEEKPELKKKEFVEEKDPNEGKEIITGTIAKGDRAASLLNTLMPGNMVQSLLDVTREVYSLSQIHEGQPYTLVRNQESGILESFEYEIDSNRKLIVTNIEDKLSARLEEIEYETKLCLVSGKINSSLFQSMTEAGETANLAMLIADIFAWEINFIKDIKKNDSFTVLVEKRYREGDFKKYGRVLAAFFVNQGKTFEAFRFADIDGHYRFFNSNGESLEKTLLKAPLPFTRVTSGYTMTRRHPIYSTIRPHQGVDYGAPAGTPVKAVGSGVITTSGWVGGYGKQVVIRHSGKLESMYSHLSKFGRGIKSGIKVRQGQVIGYVGSTGVSTGPHLDFRLKQNGSFVNPTKVINPRVDDLPKKLFEPFKKYIVTMKKYLDGSLNLSDYK